MSHDALQLELVASGAEPAEVEDALRRLHDELETVGGIDVSRPEGSAQRGAKAGEFSLVGQLLVTLLGSGGVAVAMVGVLKDWLTRHQGMKLRVKRGNDEIEVSGTTPDELAKLLSRMKAWMPEPPAKGR